jgi:hypothetical protein
VGTLQSRLRQQDIAEKAREMGMDTAVKVHTLEGVEKHCACETCTHSF